MCILPLDHDNAVCCRNCNLALLHTGLGCEYVYLLVQLPIYMPYIHYIHSERQKPSIIIQNYISIGIAQHIGLTTLMHSAFEQVILGKESHFLFCPEVLFHGKKMTEHPL